MKLQYRQRQYKEDCAFGAIVVVVFAAKGLSVCGRREKRNVIVCRGFCANTSAACSIFWIGYLLLNVLQFNTVQG